LLAKSLDVGGRLHGLRPADPADATLGRQAGQVLRLAVLQVACAAELSCAPRVFPSHHGDPGGIPALHPMQVPVALSQNRS
jgi:hypothetical protein